VLLFLVGGCRSILELFAIVVGAGVVALRINDRRTATTHTTINPSRRNRLAIWTHLRRASPTPDMNVRVVRGSSLEAQSSLEAMPSRKRRPHVLIQKVVTLEQVAVAAFSCKAVVYQWEGSTTRCLSPVFWQRISGARQRRVSVRV
jgi:hypothetical protein